MGGNAVIQYLPCAQVIHVKRLVSANLVHMRLNAASRTAETVARIDALDSPEVHFCCQKYEN